MNVQQSVSCAAGSSEQRDASTCLRGSWLYAIRCIGVILAVLLLAFFIANLPPYFAQLQTICKQPVCAQWQLSIAQARSLEQAGISMNQYTIFTLALSLFSALVWFAVGGLIAWRKSDDRVALLTALLLIVQGALEPCGFLSDGTFATPLSYGFPAWNAAAVFFLLLEPPLIIFVFTLFPDGRFVPGWMRYLVLPEILLITSFTIIHLLSLNNHGILIPLLLTVSWFSIVVSIIGGQIYRYRHVASASQRRQIGWIILGTIAELTWGLVYIFPPLFFPQLHTHGSLYFLLAKPLFFSLSIFGPLCMGIAILRYRLWNIDLIINRTLVYGTLTASVIGIYVLAVGYLGSLLRIENELGFSLITTGVIAVLFQPLRQRLQRAVNRLMYGERDDPYVVLARLGSRLEAALMPEEVLPTIVETIAQALKLPYVAIALLPERPLLTATEIGEPYIVAVSGTPIADPVRVPLVYRAETIGYLLLAAREGDTFGKADTRLLADLARQAGVAVYAVRLTTHLQLLTEGLQQTRERLVTAREEERRRLRRDLHDGLGPALASLTFKVDAARSLLKRDSERAEMLLAEVGRQVQDAIADIRRLVYGLRPPTLDELGLLSALREHTAHYKHRGLEVTFDTPATLPPLPAAVEVAAYRIALEALTNVVCHAQARHCLLRLAIDGETFHLDITDDGKGIPAGHHAGVGLHAMHERASELGGSCIITRNSSRGTAVRVTLPLAGVGNVPPLHAVERERPHS